MRDAHHLLHYRQEWSMRPAALSLREHRTLIPRLPREIHEALHTECPPVPLLGYHALRRTMSLWTPDSDVLTSIDNLQFAMQEAARHPRSHVIESQLAYLAIAAIDLQKPFIREGLGNV